MADGRKKIERVLIMKWSAMGDVVIATAAMEDVRRAFPDAAIDLQTTRAWLPLFAEDARFDNVFSADIRSPGGIWSWLRAVRRGRYDLVIDLQSNDRSRWLLALLTLLGWAPKLRLGNHPVFPYNLSSGIAPGTTRHVFDVHQQTLSAIGVESFTSRPCLYVPDSAHERARVLMQQHGLESGNFAVLFPGSQAAGFLKRWGVERYAELGRRLVAEGVGKVVLIGGPDDVEECAQIAGLADADWMVNLCGQTAMLDIVPICAEARLIVGNDTGTSHIASSTTTPLLVICGPTDPARVKPVGDQVYAIQATGVCINCYSRQCNHEEYHACMKAVSVDSIMEKLHHIKAL